MFAPLPPAENVCQNWLSGNRFGGEVLRSTEIKLIDRIGGANTAINFIASRANTCLILLLHICFVCALHLILLNCSVNWIKNYRSVSCSNMSVLGFCFSFQSSIHSIVHMFEFSFVAFFSLYFFQFEWLHCFVVANWMSWILENWHLPMSEHKAHQIPTTIHLQKKMTAHGCMLWAESIFHSNISWRF